MKAIVSVVVVCLFLLVVTSLLAAPPTPAAKIDRGKYLVENVGMCGDCHTPHNEKGEPIREKWLQGSPLAFKPTVPMPVWAQYRRPGRVAGQRCGEVPDDGDCL